MEVEVKPTKTLSNRCSERFQFLTCVFIAETEPGYFFTQSVPLLWVLETQYVGKKEILFFVYFSPR